MAIDEWGDPGSVLELVLARLELPRAGAVRCTAGAEENAFWVGVTLNPEHSAHLRRIVERTSLSRVKTYDLGDGASKNCGSRAQIERRTSTSSPTVTGG